MDLTMNNSDIMMIFHGITKHMCVYSVYIYIIICGSDKTWLYIYTGYPLVI